MVHRSARSDRSRLHAALADPTRLAIVDELGVSDRSPGELSEFLDLPGNLLAHHLDVLARVGLIERFVSSGDRRRRYVRLDRRPLAILTNATGRVPSSVLFVCTHNSARSQLAAALWNHRIGTRATSAGTHPAAEVHPGAVAAARRLGIDLSGAAPSRLTFVAPDTQIVTVCDRAHEELEPDGRWWHWSIPDPVETAAPEAFDAAAAAIDTRVSTLARSA